MKILEFSNTTSQKFSKKENLIYSKKFSIFTNNIKRNTANSAFDDSNRPQLDTLLADSSRMASVHNVRYIFVRIWGFFHDEFGGGYSNRNIFCFHFFENVHVVKISTGFRSG